MSHQVYNLAHSFIQQESTAAARLLEEQETADIAGFLSKTPQHLTVMVIKAMLPSRCAAVLLEADFSSAFLWLGELTNNHVSAILRHMDKTQQAHFLAQFSNKRRVACQRLLTYNNDSLGAWVESEVPVFPQDMTTGDALKRLKLKGFQEDKIIFVVDEQRRPTGSLSVPTLLRNPNRAATIDSLAEPVDDVLNGWVTLSTAIGHRLWQHQDVVAVVDLHREFIGVIWYSRLRHLLSTQSTLLETPSLSSGASTDLLQAYGESMRAMLGVIKRCIS